MPKVSVLLPVFNSEKYLRDSIDSILAQTYTDFELVIVDDGSTDATPEIISAVKDPRVRTLKNESNLGLQKSLNRAISTCSSEYLARHDADDISHPDRLRLQADFLDRNPHIAVVGSAAEWINEDGKSCGMERYPTNEVDLRWGLLFAWGILHPTVMMRRSVIVNEGGYSEDPAVSVVEDLELWSRVMLRHGITNLGDCLLRYRLNSSSVTARHRERHQRQLEAESVSNISRLLGDEFDSRAALLLRRFIYGSHSAGHGFTREEADLAARAYARLLFAFYRDLPPASGRWRHRARTSYRWAKHAAALALKPGSGCKAGARLRLARWSAEMIARTLEPM